MTKVSKPKSQQPEALAEMAVTSREEIPGEGNRELTADAKNKPLFTQNKVKHEVAETLLAAAAQGKEADPKRAGVEKLPDRTRRKN